MRVASSAVRRRLGFLTLSLIFVSPASWSATQLSLDGVDDYAREGAETTSPSPLDVSTFTVEAWIFPTAFRPMTIVSDSAYALDVYLNRTNGLGVRWMIFNQDPHRDRFSGIQDGEDIILNQWNHVAGAFDASTNICWIAINGKVQPYNRCLDGEPDLGKNQFFGAGVSSVGGVGPNAPPRPTIAPFAGRIAEIRLSNLIRYSSDFNVPTSCFYADNNTLGLWHLDQTVDSTNFMDSSGHGYTLIGFNGAKTIEGPPPVSCEKPRAELTPASLAFGDQQVGTLSPVQTVTLANPGAAPLAITGIAASGDFRHNANCGSILAAYASCGIEVIFAPTASGSRAGSLTVVSDAAGSPHTIINLSGSGVEPLVDLSPGGLAFGEQQVGIPSAAQVITLTNTGTASLAIINIAILGDFAQNNDCGPALAPAASCRIHITFTPAANGNRGGELTLVTNAANSPHAVGLVGLGVAPAADLNPGSLAFGERQVGSAGSARIVALTNIGAAALSVNSITTTSGDFIQTNACGATLPPGGSCNISVTFKPTAGGARTGQLIIASNAGGSPHSVSLNGVGMQRFELKIKKYGNGDGAITSSPSGINCGKDCKETYPRNKKVKLIAKAKKGSTFQGWISACGGSASTCKVTLSQAKTVNVLFAKKNYYVLIVSTAGNGKGGVSSSPSGIKCKSTCSKSYRRDTQVKLTAKADRGSVFAGWSGSCSGKSKTCVVKLSKVRSVKANFKSRSKSSYDYWLDDALLQQDDQGPTDNLDPMAPASKEEEQP